MVEVDISVKIKLVLINIRNNILGIDYYKEMKEVYIIKMKNMTNMSHLITILILLQSFLKIIYNRSRFSTLFN